MNCADLEAMLAGYEASDLAPAQHEFVALHLQGCDRCQETMANLRFARRTLGGWPSHGPDIAVTANVMARLRPGMAKRPSPAALALGAAAAALVLAIGLSAVPTWVPGGRLPAATFGALTATSWVELSTVEQSAAAAVGLPPALDRLLVDDHLLLLTLDGDLVRYTSPDQPELLMPELQGRLLAATSESVWLVRSDVPGFFSLDIVDLQAAQVSRDPFARQGVIHSGKVANSGLLYLLASVGSTPYLKIFDPATHMLERAVGLDSRFAEEAVLVSDDQVIVLVGAGVLGRVADQRVHVISAPDLTLQAVLVGGRLLTLNAPGLLSVVDPADGSTLSQYRAPSALTSITLSPDGRFIYGQAGRSLYVASVDAPGSWHRVHLR